MGGLVKLEPKQDRDGFAVVWAIPPDLASLLASTARMGPRRLLTDTGSRWAAIAPRLVTLAGRESGPRHA
jgi:hypothetical protein